MKDYELKALVQIDIGGTCDKQLSLKIQDLRIKEKGDYIYIRGTHKEDEHYILELKRVKTENRDEYIKENCIEKALGWRENIENALLEG